MKPFFPEAPSAALYVHVPFCAGKCDYCDFYSVPVTPEDPRKAAFVDLVLEHGKIAAERFMVKRIPTVYIGGGTPSVLGAKLITRLLRGLGDLFAAMPETSAPREITLEANPESCTEDFLIAAMNAGVTRLSIGAQTFHEASRQAVRRTGEGRLLPERLQLISELFQRNFSVDLISGLPFQDETILKKDIEKVISYNPGHISLYSLIVEPDTPLGVRAADNRVSLPRKDKADDLWIIGRGFLESSGYEQYEISNFSIPGRQSLHNLRYWRMENWIGIGPAASGTIIDDETGTGRRFTNNADIDLWLQKPPGQFFGTVETLDELTLIKEHLLMGFRLTNGPCRDLFKKRFGKTIEEMIPETIGKWRGRELFCQGETALTRDGLLLLDAFLIDAFGEIDQTKKNINSLATAGTIKAENRHGK